MATMSPIVASVDGVSYSFQLLEADIPVLTLDIPPPSTPVGGTPPNVIKWLALAAAIGANWEGDPCGPPWTNYIPSFFRPMLTPDFSAGHGANFSWTMPTGKPALTSAANALGGSGGYFPTACAAVLAMALTGGGMALATAGGVAQNLMRSNSTGAVRQLVAQICNAAAAA